MDKFFRARDLGKQAILSAGTAGKERLRDLLMNELQIPVAVIDDMEKNLNWSELSRRRD